MKTLTINPVTEPFSLEIDTIAPDKSISHRCAIFSLLSDKPSVVSNYLEAEDTLNTLKIVQALGAKVTKVGDTYTITPPLTPQEADDVLDCGNSGTAIRLICGYLAGIDGHFVLTGDEYLRRRPMKRVANPLRSIGAKIDGRKGGDLAPLAIRGAQLQGFDYASPIASAQVKSALILAALRASSPSKFSEPELSRDHTERMLRGMGADVQSKGTTVEIQPLTTPLSPLSMRVPADPSSAFFFAVAAAITPHARVILKDVLLNPTRIEAFKVLEKMGAFVSIKETSSQYETIGDIEVAYAPLNGVCVEDNISWLIDELPALGIAMAFAQGISQVRNAEELRVKESDRIKSLINNLALCGIQTVEYDDGYDIVGGAMQAATINSFGDHRVAMSFAIAGLQCGMTILDTACTETSFPNFDTILQDLTQVAIEWK